MFGLLPLLRGVLMLAAILLALAVALWVLAAIAAFVLRGFNIDWAELKHFRERKRQFDFQLRGLEAQLGEADPRSEQFEQLCLNLKALQGAAPRPPQWAFWLR